MKSKTCERHETRDLTKASRKLKYLAICYGVTVLLFGTMLVSAFSNSPFLNSPFAGGWEFTGCISTTTLGNTTFNRFGTHSFSMDVDGDFVVAQNVYPAAFDRPGITVETSYPYYITQSMGSWITTEAPAYLDQYNVTLVNNASEVRVQYYYQWTIGMDITVKTDAGSYYKPPSGYYDYGYSFEYLAENVVVLINVASTPWTPAGVDGNWSVVGGWNGIMSASVVALDYGLISEAATENYGHTIQNLNSIGSALNMYTSADAFAPVSFTDTIGLKGVPTSVDVEVGARLAAGADYDTDALGHWSDVAVRNVFVTYKLRIDVLSTLIWAMHLGHQGPLHPPDENNTKYKPALTWWDELWEGVRQFFYSMGFPTTIFVLALVAVVIVVMYLRGRGRTVYVEAASRGGGRR